MKQLTLIAAVALTALHGCSELDKKEGHEENWSAVAADYASAFENASPLQLFFKEDRTRAIFQQEGSSDTFFTEETSWLSENYVEMLLERNGVAGYSIYRITESTVEIVYEGASKLEATLTELEQMPSKGIFLSLPLEVGTSFDGWVITHVDWEVQTPFDTFEQITMTTKKIGGEEIQRYFTPGFGLVKETRNTATDGLQDEAAYLLYQLEYR